VELRLGFGDFLAAKHVDRCGFFRSGELDWHRRTFGNEKGLTKCGSALSSVGV
jgi:hypothetical protein